ncbi:MerR family transcriptional regulator [Lysobacter korlensis]|uniref:MerR family transcriptional regulator n=1 Tax=Lysobacter korlensis TaxID=553636 RepID=A0ABV6RZE9_9GAMM
MRIGELSRRTAVSERSLRYYEQQGLLEAQRTPGGQREYDLASVDRVIRIQELFAAGLRSRTIAELLPCMRDADGGPNEHTTPLLERELRAQRRRLDRAIAELTLARDVLDGVIEAATAPSPDGSREQRLVQY